MIVLTITFFVHNYYGEVLRVKNAEISKKHAAIYIRVSTDAQAEEGYSIDAQIERLNAFCVSKDIENYEHYIDRGWSGSNIERPEITRLIQDVKDDKVSHVIVYKLDRLSRSQKDTLYLIEDVFNPHNADFISINENMDTSTPMGRLMLGILSAFAQLERENIRERTRMGMLERVKAGLWPGGGRVPYGYDYDREQGILVPNKDSEKVRQMYELAIKGYTSNRIAKMLGFKFDNQVTKILRRKTNLGLIEYNDVEYQGRHEPLIDKETFDKAQDVLDSRRTNRVATSENLLTSVIYCGVCGAKMRYQNWGAQGKKLTCYSQQTTHKHMVKDSNCDNDKPLAAEVEEIVKGDLFRFSLEQQKLRNIKVDANPETIINEQIKAQEAKIKRLYNSYGDSGNELLLETITENEKELLNLRKHLEQEQSSGKTSKRIENLRDEVSNLSDVWDFMTIDEKRNILSNVVERVVYEKDNLTVKYVF